MFIGYIQHDEDKAEQTRQYKIMQSFAQDKGINLDCIYVDYAFENIKDIIQPNCRGILLCKISSLGDSLAEIKNNLLYFRKRNLTIFSIEDNYKFKEDNLTDDFFKGIDIAIEVRSDIISQNVKKVLKRRKTEGAKLGRPLGVIVKKRLEGKENEIRKLLAQKISKAEIARRYGVTRTTVFNFIKRNGLESDL